MNPAVYRQHSFGIQGASYDGSEGSRETPGSYLRRHAVTRIVRPRSCPAVYRGPQGGVSVYLFFSPVEPYSVSLLGKKLDFSRFLEVVFACVFCLLLRRSRGADARAHLGEYWLSLGRYCKFRLSAVFARNEKQQILREISPIIDLEIHQKTKAGKDANNLQKTSKKHPKCLP